MAIVFTVETGTGSSTATSYITVAELDQYMVNDGLTLNLTTEAEKQAALNRMTTVLDAHAKWPGIRYSSGQSLEWPRSEAYYKDGNYIGVKVPDEIKKALAFFVYYSNSGTDVTPVRETAPVKSESSAVSGAVSESKEYWYNAKDTPEITEISMILRRLVNKNSCNLGLRR